MPCNSSARVPERKVAEPHESRVIVDQIQLLDPSFRRHFVRVFHATERNEGEREKDNRIECMCVCVCESNSTRKPLINEGTIKYVCCSHNQWTSETGKRERERRTIVMIVNDVRVEVRVT